MRLLAMTFGGAMAAAALGGQALAQEDGVRIEHAAARVIVIPEARSNVSVSVRQGRAPLPPLRMRQEGRTVVVDGDLWRRIGSCGGVNIGLFSWHGRRPPPERGEAVFIRGVGRVRVEDLPVITARVPLRAHVEAGDAVWGQIGAMDDLSFGNAGCGDWSLGDVRGRLGIGMSGSGDVQAGSAGELNAGISGSGDLTMGGVRGPAAVAVSGSSDTRLGPVGAKFQVRVAGSGDVRAAAVNGLIQAKIAGSGDVVIEGGQSPQVAVQIGGSGDFTFKGVAGALSAQVAGSGDVHVARVTGPVSRSVVGSGEVEVGR